MPIDRFTITIPPQDIPDTARQESTFLTDTALVHIANVEINGMVLWPSALTLDFEELASTGGNSSDSLLRTNSFQVSMQPFLSDAKVASLNIGLCNLIWNRLIRQYQSSNPSIVFPTKVPVALPTILRFKQKGLVFSCELYCTIHDDRGAPVCELGIIATLDLSLPMQSTIYCEIMVDSLKLNPPTIDQSDQRSQFTFIALGKRQNEQKTQLGQSGLIFSTSQYNSPDPKAALLQNIDGEMKKCIETLKNGTFFKTTEIEILLYPLIRLFHLILKRRVIELRDATVAVIPAQLNTLVVDILKKNIPLKVLLAEIKGILLNIFREEAVPLTDQKLAELLTILNDPKITALLESARFISKNPSLCLIESMPRCEEYTLACTAYIVQLSITTFRETLETLANNKQFMSLGFADPQSIENRDEISPLFVNYLLNAVQNRLSDNPFADPLTLSSLTTNPLIMGAFLSEISNAIQAPSSVIPDTLRVSAQSNSESMELLVISLRPPIKKIECCPKSLDPETRAALLKRNPMIIALNYGPALYFAILQILELDPHARNTALPYLFIIEWFGDAFGFWIGVDSILHPNLKKEDFSGLFDLIDNPDPGAVGALYPEKAKRMHPLARGFESLTKAAVVLVCDLDIVINAYLLRHPLTKEISSKEFLLNLAPAPVILAAAYGVWNFILPEHKSRWFPENSPKRHLKTILDVLTTFFLYTGIMDLSLLKSLHLFDISTDPVYHLGPIIAGLFIAGVQHLVPSYTERLSNCMIHLSALNFIWLLAEDLKQQLGSFNNSLLPSLRILFLAAETLASIVFIAGKGASFLEEYQAPKFIARRITNNSHHIQDDLTSTIKLNPTQFQSLLTQPLTEELSAERTTTLTFVQKRQAAQLPTFSEQAQNENSYVEISTEPRRSSFCPLL